MNRRHGPRYVDYVREQNRLKVIVPTGGCRVPTCTFCALAEVASKKEIPQWERLIPAQYYGVDEVALYTDGSFFDPAELTNKMRALALRRLGEIGAKRLIVESLPRFLSDTVLRAFFADKPRDLEVIIAVGVQSCDPAIRAQCLGTPISSEEIGFLFDLRQRFGFGLRIYLMAGKPLLTADEDLTDVRSSVAALSGGLRSGDIITINRLIPTTGTFVDSLLSAGLYERASLCDMRRTIQLIRQEYPNLNIRPGCIGRQTCAPGASHSVDYCSSCFSWLSAAEKGQATHELACEAANRNSHGLPWYILEGVHRRRAFAQRLVSEMGDGSRTTALA